MRGLALDTDEWELLLEVVRDAQAKASGAREDRLSSIGSEIERRRYVSDDDDF